MSSAELFVWAYDVVDLKIPYALPNKVSSRLPLEVQQFSKSESPVSESANENENEI